MSDEIEKLTAKEIRSADGREIILIMPDGEQLESFPVSNDDERQKAWRLAEKIGRATARTIGVNFVREPIENSDAPPMHRESPPAEQAALPPNQSEDSDTAPNQPSVAPSDSDRTKPSLWKSIWKGR